MYKKLPFIKTSGISLPLASLKYKEGYGIGDIKGAYKFIDFLSEIEWSTWKILPINDFNISPYASLSFNAIDSIYVDLSDIEDLKYTDIEKYLHERSEKLNDNENVEYFKVRNFKYEILRIAFEEFMKSDYGLKSSRDKDFRDFINENHSWLEDYALFKSILTHFKNTPLKNWPDDIRRREKEAIEKYKKDLFKECLFYKYIQWILYSQWKKLHNYALKNDVSIIGDIQFYPSLNSVEVWSKKEFFLVNPNLDTNLFPGVSGDEIFPKDQIWKDLALYNWDNLKKQDYAFIMERLDGLSILFDAFRLDYFKGFCEYEVFDSNKNTFTSHVGPGFKILNEVIKKYQDRDLIKIIGENLNIENEKIENLRRKVGIDGYLTFEYDYKKLFSNKLKSDFYVQTSTHDMPSLFAWWSELEVDNKKYITNSLFCSNNKSELSEDLRWRIIEYLLNSEFREVSIALTDILGLNSRINLPGLENSNNWCYRVNENIEDILNDENLINRLKNYSKEFKRNRHFRSYDYSFLFELNNEVIREYSPNEEVILFLLSERKEGVKCNIAGPETNLTYNLKEVEDYEEGFLYKLKIKLKKEGSYKMEILNLNSDIVNSLQVNIR